MDIRIQEILAQNMVKELTPEAKDEIIMSYIKSDINSYDFERKIKDQTASQIQNWIRTKVEQKLQEPENIEKLDNIVTELVADYLNDKQLISRWLAKKLLIKSANNISRLVD